MKRILFYLSLLFNLVMIALFSVSEHQGKGIQYMLERRGYCEIPKHQRTDRFAIGGWTNTMKKMDIKCDALFFGNSITLGSDFQSYFTDKKIINLGYGGNNTIDLINRVQTINVCSPSKIFIMAGTNDLFHVDIDTYKKRYEKLLAAIIESNPNSKIYIQSVLPYNHSLCPDAPNNNKVKTANDSIKALCDRLDLTFIDLFSITIKDGEMSEDLSKDGIHINDKCYLIWAKEIEKYIK